MRSAAYGFGLRRDAVEAGPAGYSGCLVALGYAVLARRTGATGRRPGAVIEVAPAEETEKAPAGA